MTCTFQGNPIKLTADFSSETMEARGSGTIYSKKIICQPRALHPVKLSFKYEDKIKIFPDKQKRREFLASRPILQILKEVLQMKAGNSG